jgi:hypothetical protein
VLPLFASPNRAAPTERIGRAPFVDYTKGARPVFGSKFSSRQPVFVGISVKVKQQKQVKSK